MFHNVRGELRTALELAGECLRLAEQTNDEGLLLAAHQGVGVPCLYRGEFVRARAALVQGLALSQPQPHAQTLVSGGLNPRVVSRAQIARVLWFLGYPEQALTRMDEALRLVRELGHPFGLANAFLLAASFHTEWEDGRLAQEHADAGVALASEQGFLTHLALGTIYRGEVLLAQEQWAEGVAQVRQSLEAYAGKLTRTMGLTWLARGYGGVGQMEDGLAAVAEALRLVEKNDERFYEAEVYRVKGELTLQSKVQGPKSKVEEEAEECFPKAVEIAQKQQAKSLELRAVMSLARLWQSQGKTTEARQMLAEIYGWFTEGFETKDLQEAKVLLEELSP